MLWMLLICTVAFFILVWKTRLTSDSIGLPIAYLFSLHLHHLPGGFAHLVGEHVFLDSTSTEIGLKLTAIGTVCFVTGVLAARRVGRGRFRSPSANWLASPGLSRFIWFCLISVWFLVLFVSLFGRIPSLRAAIDRMAMVWVLGVLVGLLRSIHDKSFVRILLWMSILVLYPFIALVMSGFLGLGTTSVFVVMATLLVRLKSSFRAYSGLIVFSMLCFLLFLSYFQNRDNIRDAVWGGAGFEDRVATSFKMVTDIRWFDPSDRVQLIALHERLNQNRFVGMAAQNIESGRVDLLYGRSVWEGLLAMVPRVIWPGKPIFAGSSQLIREVAGFQVNDTTTYGVGQVMEFYINFGTPSLVIGFLVFGFAYGWIDMNVAVSLRQMDFGAAMSWFLLGVALLAPLASVAELMGNLAAAIVGGYMWRVTWRFFEKNANLVHRSGITEQEY